MSASEGREGATGPQGPGVLAEQIVECVGGPANVAEVTHCWTRLRLVLRDDHAADVDALGALEGVVIALRQGGQTHLVPTGDLLSLVEQVRSAVSAGPAPR